MENEEINDEYAETRTAPVQTGDEITLTIEGIGDKGDPFSKISGFVVFIHETNDNNLNKGMEVSVEITKVLKNFAFADLVEVLE